MALTRRLSTAHLCAWRRAAPRLASLAPACGGLHSGS